MEHDGIEWTGRGGGHVLHAVAATEPSGRATFGCGREGWPVEPSADPPPTRCDGCAVWAVRRLVEPIPDPMAERRAAWG